MNNHGCPVRPQLSHAGIFAVDLDTLVPFYERMLGLMVTDRGVMATGSEIVFMSATAEQHHQLVVVSGRAPGAPSTVNQLSFKVDDLNELRAYAEFLTARDISYRPLSHGNAWSLYFEDPEQNRIEVYCDTPWYVSQPCAIPIDLLADPNQLLADTEAFIEREPSGVPVAEWQADFRRRQASRSTTD